jgi:Zn-dependent metalloprotease
MSHRSVNCIVPPHILRKLLDSKDRKLREIALHTLLASTQIRAQRDIISLLPNALAVGEKRRTIFDAKNAEPDPPQGTRVRGEEDPPVSDHAVNEAFDGLGATYDFYKQVLSRNSIDGNGLRLDAIVHYGEAFNNAFWNGQVMVFGDGDEDLFTGFTKSLDVIAHELTHGVTENTAGLVYHKQPGALNESMSDVFGCLVKQWMLQQDAASADWLIGAEVFTPGLEGDALRSMKAPGTAYDNDTIGKDPQPGHMENYQNLPDTRFGDNGGVHVNSGIPNHAFYLAAVAIGGNAWDAAGHIWYETLVANSGPDAKFQDFADATVGVAGRLYGPSSEEQVAVREAWHEVGIQVRGVGSIRPEKVRAGTARETKAAERESLTDLHAKVDALAKTVEQLARKKVA